jgi:hypothetical protein
VRDYLDRFWDTTLTKFARLAAEQAASGPARRTAGSSCSAGSTGSRADGTDRALRRWWRGGSGPSVAALVRRTGVENAATLGRWEVLDSTRTVPVGTWTHVAATYDGARLRLFIGGRVAGSLAVTGRTCANDEPLAVGAKDAPALGILEAFWDGRLDDVRIYRRALPGAAVADLAP